MSLIYSTNEYKGYGKHEYGHYEYRLEGDTVHKVRCNRGKTFDGEETTWYETEKEVDSWQIDDPSMPDWLHKYL